MDVSVGLCPPWLIDKPGGDHFAGVAGHPKPGSPFIRSSSGVITAVADDGKCEYARALARTTLSAQGVRPMVGRRVVIAAAFLAVAVSTSVSAAGRCEAEAVGDGHELLAGRHRDVRSGIGLGSRLDRVRPRDSRERGSEAFVVSAAGSRSSGPTSMRSDPDDDRRLAARLPHRGQLRQTRPPTDGATARERAGWRTEGRRRRSGEASRPSSSILLPVNAIDRGRAHRLDSDRRQDGRGRGRPQVVPLGLLHEQRRAQRAHAVHEAGSDEPLHAARRRRQTARMALVAREHGRRRRRPRQAPRARPADPRTSNAEGRHGSGRGYGDRLPSRLRRRVCVSC